MPAQTPRQWDELFEKAFNAGDAGGLVGLYEPEATLLPQPGTAVTGPEAIRGALDEFLALKGQITMRTGGVIEGPDLAVVYTDWSLTGGTDPEGTAVELGAHSTVVLRKQADGSWLGVLDDPYSSG